MGGAQRGACGVQLLHPRGARLLAGGDHLRHAGHTTSRAWRGGSATTSRKRRAHLTIDELEWRNALSDCLGCPDPTLGWGGNLQLGSDYFTFADKLEATLRGIGRRQVREAEGQATMINSLLIDSGWHHLLDKKDERCDETDSWSDTDEESGRDDNS